jgi:hypothetical protein
MDQALRILKSKRSTKIDSGDFGYRPENQKRVYTAPIKLNPARK